MIVRRRVKLGCGGLTAVILWAAGARAELQWTGVIGQGTEDRVFYLVDSATPSRGAWLRLGQRFGGFAVRGYEDAGCVLILANATQTLRLTLAATTGAAVTPQSASSSPPPANAVDEGVVGPGQVRIVAGDTMFALARRSGLSIQALMQLNPDVVPNRLRVGQILRVRAADAPTPAPPPGGGR